jgi:hypothetical protein
MRPLIGDDIARKYACYFRSGVKPVKRLLS